MKADDGCALRFEYRFEYGDLDRSGNLKTDDDVGSAPRPEKEKL